MNMQGFNPEHFGWSCSDGAISYMQKTSRSSFSQGRTVTSAPAVMYMILSGP